MLLSIVISKDRSSLAGGGYSQYFGVPPDFRRDLSFPDMYNRPKFEYCAFRGFKVNSSEEKEKKKANSIQVGVNEHNRKQGS